MQQIASALAKVEAGIDKATLAKVEAALTKLEKYEDDVNIQKIESTLAVHKTNLDRFLSQNNG